jgi:hypothetical protein
MVDADVSAMRRDATFQIDANVTCRATIGIAAWWRENASNAKNIRSRFSKRQIQSPSYDLYREIKFLPQKEGVRMQTYPLLHVCKPVKQLRKHFVPLLNSARPESNSPYHQADISLTATTNLY